MRGIQPCRPKIWGWRFIGADIQMPNGQLVECYGTVAHESGGASSLMTTCALLAVVFTQMDDCKKHARYPDLHAESNHEVSGLVWHGTSLPRSMQFLRLIVSFFL